MTRDEFVCLCVAEGALEVDTPGSTRDISDELLFARQDPSAPLPGHRGRRRRPARRRRLPGSLHQAPARGTPTMRNCEELLDGYLAALAKVSAHVAR
ncbi:MULTISPECIES: hypothetical protein [unclassified Nonomuraea]|uniref:hypothetical protein n=1 Tax=unclassified Nonomuraea TaxID=2593643 RepID=UPI00340075F9